MCVKRDVRPVIQIVHVHGADLNASAHLETRATLSHFFRLQSSGCFNSSRGLEIDTAFVRIHRSGIGDRAISRSELDRAFRCFHEGLVHHGFPRGHVDRALRRVDRSGVFDFALIRRDLNFAAHRFKELCIIGGLLSRQLDAPPVRLHVAGVRQTTVFGDHPDLAAGSLHDGVIDHILVCRHGHFAVRRIDRSIVLELAVFCRDLHFSVNRFDHRLVIDRLSRGQFDVALRNRDRSPVHEASKERVQMKCSILGLDHAFVRNVPDGLKLHAAVIGSDHRIGIRARLKVNGLFEEAVEGLGVQADLAAVGSDRPRVLDLVPKAHRVRRRFIHPNAHHAIGRDADRDRVPCRESHGPHRDIDRPLVFNRVRDQRYKTRVIAHDLPVIHEKPALTVELIIVRQKIRDIEIQRDR